jgi:hypothetical protein
MVWLSGKRLFMIFGAIMLLHQSSSRQPPEGARSFRKITAFAIGSPPYI